MKWAVCKYGGGGMVILPTSYVTNMLMSNHPDFQEFEIVRTFNDKEIALEYLTELLLADNLIYKALK